MEIVGGDQGVHFLSALCYCIVEESLCIAQEACEFTEESL